MDRAKLLEKTVGVFGRSHAMLAFLIYLSGFVVAFHVFVRIVVHYDMFIGCEDVEFDICDKACKKPHYDLTYMDNSLVFDWHLICDKAWINTLIQCIVMFGFLLGNLILGWISDKFGRRIPLLVEIVVQIIAGIGAGFVEDYIYFTVLRFISTFATGGLMLTTFILLMEGLDQKYRSSICILYQLPVYVGHTLISLFCYFIRSYIYIQVTISVLGVILLSYIFLMHESTPWLLLKKRKEVAVKLLKKQATFNHLPLDDIQQEVEIFMADNSPNTPPGRITDLYRTKRMRIKVLVLCFNWFVTANLNYGAGKIKEDVSVDFYFNIAFFGLIQIPGNVVCVFTCARIGRKLSLVVGYCIALVPYLISMVLPSESYWPLVICGCISLNGCAMCVTILYVYSAEMLPTVVRNTGMGLMSMFFWAGTIASMYIMHTNTIGFWLPYLIIGIPAIGAVIVTFLFLPDTLNVPLPDTLEDADEL